MTSYSKKSAFSLIEVSIVILIIGLLIVGVVGSRHLITKSHITTAIAMTKSSPISGTLNNKLWIESSLSEVSLGQNLNTGDAITHWLDNSSNQNPPMIVSVGDGPVYANTINYIQAVKFGSTSDEDHLQITNADFLNNTDYTIFILEKRIATNSGSGNYLLGSTSSFALGYESETTMIQTHGESAGEGNQSSIESLSSYSNKPRALTFVHSSTNGNKIYINGTLANEDSSSEAQTHLSGITSLDIGNNYNGEIGEIVIFDRALKSIERIEIENYLSDKWGAPNNRDQISSCTSGIITSTGCDASCLVSIYGVSTTSVADGVSGSFTCNASSAYDSGDTISYSCAEGSLSITGNQYCDCASGYSNSSEGNICVADCSISETGISETTVPVGTDNLTCSTGYTGTVNYTCSGGSSATINSGSCFENCDVTISGASTTEVTSASGSFTCSDTGYDGSTITYTCSGGTLTPSSSTCGCDTGSNYTDSNEDGICEAPCTLSSEDSGLGSNIEVLSGSSSYDCTNTTGYTGTVSYTCSNGSISSISGTCSELIEDCTGGVKTSITVSSTNYKVHKFLLANSGTSFTCPTARSVEYLVVGGGGGAGYDGSGGGGGGGVRTGSLTISNSPYTITVGSGGAVSSSTVGTQGSNGGSSIFSSITALGGGGGGSKTAHGRSGGSGGGAGHHNSGSAYLGGSGSSGQGYSGGNGNFQGGGGGGGAGGAGQVGSGGNGGIGIASSITGTSTYYGGGGGGGTYDGSGSGIGGNGGGGNGSLGSSSYSTAGANGYGGGGGGAGVADGYHNGSSGGSGVVIIRYVTN